jgi:hypothetical protein
MKVNFKQQRAILLAGCSFVTVSSVSAPSALAQTVGTQPQPAISAPRSQKKAAAALHSHAAHGARSAKMTPTANKQVLAQLTKPTSPGETQGPATDITDKQLSRNRSWCKAFENPWNPR